MFLFLVIPGIVETGKLRAHDSEFDGSTSTRMICDYYVLTGSIITFGRISKCRSMQTRCHCSLIKESTLYSKHIAVLNIAFIGLSDAVYQCRAIEH